MGKKTPKSAAEGMFNGFTYEELRYGNFCPKKEGGSMKLI